MRVVLDYRPAILGRGGIAVYVQELAAALGRASPEDAFVLFAAHRRRVDAGVAPPESNVHLFGAPWPSRVQVVAARFGWGPERLAGGGDVLHWTDYTVLPRTRLPVVATIHDVLFDELPQCYTAGMRRGLRAATGSIVASARRFVVPSTRTRDGLVASYGADPDAIDVVPHGVRPLPEAEPASGYGPYVLFVGTLEPRKNLARLLLAHAGLADRGSVRLVVAGPRGWKDEALVDRLRTQAGVTWEGGVGRDRLAALYRGALALAYPSLGEGFGLPVLEAMSVGLPVVVGADTTCADVAGDAGLAVDPYDVDALRAALDRLLGDASLRRRLGERGRARAGAYTWARAAAGTLASYRRAVA